MGQYRTESFCGLEALRLHCLGDPEDERTRSKKSNDLEDSGTRGSEDKWFYIDPQNTLHIYLEYHSVYPLFGIGEKA
jgi:hypothetical protein